MTSYSHFDFSDVANVELDKIVEHNQCSTSSCSCLSPIYKVITKHECKIVKRLDDTMYCVRRESFYKPVGDALTDHNTIYDDNVYYRLKKLCNDIYEVKYLKFSKVYVDDLNKPSVYAIELPCGRCTECLSRAVNRWALRLKLDIEHTRSRAFFVTLTYKPSERLTDVYDVCNDTGVILHKTTFRNLPKKHVRFKPLYSELACTLPSNAQMIYDKFESYENTGNLPDDAFEYNEYGEPIKFNYSNEYIKSNLIHYHCERGYLCYQHLRDFIKRLRTYLKYYYGISTVKYFACGEYSKAPHEVDGQMTEGFLPHYHLLIWFQDTFKSNTGWFKPRPKRNKNYGSKLLYGVKVYPNGSLSIPALSDSLFEDFVCNVWSHSDRKGFYASRVRSVEGCTRYISKYILKSSFVKDSKLFKDGFEDASYFDEGQRTFAPFKRYMSNGIGKKYCVDNRQFISTNFRFSFLDGKYTRFYPSIMLKWFYQEYDSEGRTLTYFYDNPNYFQMLRFREKYMEGIKPKDAEGVNKTSLRINTQTKQMMDSIF